MGRNIGLLWLWNKVLTREKVQQAHWSITTAKPCAIKRDKLTFNQLLRSTNPIPETFAKILVFEISLKMTQFTQTTQSTGSSSMSLVHQIMTHRISLRPPPRKEKKATKHHESQEDHPQYPSTDTWQQKRNRELITAAKNTVSLQLREAMKLFTVQDIILYNNNHIEVPNSNMIRAHIL